MGGRNSHRGLSGLGLKLVFLPCGRIKIGISAQTFAFLVHCWNGDIASGGGLSVPDHSAPSEFKIYTPIPSMEGSYF